MWCDVPLGAVEVPLVLATAPRPGSMSRPKWRRPHRHDLCAAQSIEQLSDEVLWITRLLVFGCVCFGVAAAWLESCMIGHGSLWRCVAGQSYCRAGLRRTAPDTQPFAGIASSIKGTALLPERVPLRIRLDSLVVCILA